MCSGRVRRGSCHDLRELSHRCQQPLPALLTQTTSSRQMLTACACRTRWFRGAVSATLSLRSCYAVRWPPRDHQRSSNSTFGRELKRQKYPRCVRGRIDDETGMEERIALPRTTIGLSAVPVVEKKLIMSSKSEAHAARPSMRLRVIRTLQRCQESARRCQSNGHRLRQELPRPKHFVLNHL